MIATLGPLPPESGSVAKYRQISDHLRNLINRGDLRPGTRLPGMITLAKQWKTNYFTVSSALTPLANEGLVRRTPRGTFVSNRNSRISSVAIYYGTNPWDDPEGAFFQQAYRDLRLELEKRGLYGRLIIDDRTAEQQGTPLPDLAKAMERREIQGVIGLMPNRKNLAWLESLPVPTSLLSGLSRRPKKTVLDPTQLRALARLAKAGCKTVGLIHPSFTDLYPEFNRVVTSLGMKTRENWVRMRSVTGVFRGEEFGYRELKKIWALPDRPQGLMIYPDWICRGSITAILELGIKVPRQLRLVLSCNAGLEYICPWPVLMMTTDVRKMARALVAHLLRQDPSRPVYRPVSIPPARLIG